MLFLGLGYCLEQDTYKSEIIKDLHLFIRNLSLKFLHHKQTPYSTDLFHGEKTTRKEFPALRDLTLLVHESGDYNGKDLSSEPVTNLKDEIDLKGLLSRVGPFIPDIYK